MTSSLPIVDQPVHEAGPLEKKLDDVFRIARSRLDTLKFWRETLALRRRFSLRMLRVGELRIAIPPGQTPNCDECVDICCTGPNAIVSLRLRDIAALVDHGRAQFIVPRSSIDVDTPKKDETWARKEADGSVFHRAFPVLKRDATGTCTLLTDDRMCGAYPSWPLSCARYPYALDLQLKTVFWAKGCASTSTVPAVDAPVRVRNLVRAVVDAYNERVKDAVVVYLARDELTDVGLASFLDWSKL